MSVEDVGHMWVLSSHQSAYFRELAAAEKTKYIPMFLHVFVIRDPHSAVVFLSKHSVLFLPGIKCVYGTVSAVKVNDPVIGLRAASDKTLPLTTGSLVLSCLAQRRADLLEQRNTTIEDSADPWKHHVWCGALRISRAHLGAQLQRIWKTLFRQ